MKYPKVMNEHHTVAELVEFKKSISRFGDGELKIMFGAGYAREPPNYKLQQELRKVFCVPSASCLVGIPTMDKEGPKYTATWERHKARFSYAIEESEVQTFYSAFISRPDSAPWIRNREFALLLEKVWKGKKLTVVCEDTNSILRAAHMAREIQQIRCAHLQAYSHINKLERAVMKSQPDVALLSCGPTATCLAYRLANSGIQAIDIGSAGGWLKGFLNVDYARQKEESTNDE